MFESEKLQAKGFIGANVEMVVFDTGAHAYNPHFRNIKASLVNMMLYIYIYIYFKIETRLNFALRVGNS